MCGEGVRGARRPAFCWISALLPLECWPFRESFMALKVLSWHVPPIPASRVILSPARMRLPHKEALDHSSLAVGCSDRLFPLHLLGPPPSSSPCLAFWKHQEVKGDVEA